MTPRPTKGCRFELTPPAKSALDTLTARHGMTQQVVVSRLIYWFNEQSPQVHSGILSRFNTSEADRKELLRQIAKGLQESRRSC